MNLHRRFDIALVNTDEIRITLRDDINLVINENTLWDGNYKKMSLQGSFGDAADSNEENEFQREIKKDASWTTADSTMTIKFDEFSYTMDNGVLIDTGVYSIEKIGAYDIIQFRSDLENSLLGEVYSMSFGSKTITETVKKTTVEKVVTDYDSITFTPVKITSTDCFAAEGKTYTFMRNVQ